MTEPSQYFKGRTVQEQMNEVIGYVDVRSAEVAVNAIAADVAQVHQDMLDADADASAAAASAAAAAGTLANAVKKTGEASQSIAGDIAVSGDISGGTVTVPTPVNNTDAASKKYVDDADALNVKLAGNQTIADVKTFSSSPVVPTVATGTFDTKAANGTKVKNELDNYTQMVRTANAQTIGGVKTFTSQIAVEKSSDAVFIDLKRTNVDRTAIQSAYVDLAKIRVIDTNGMDMFWIDSYVDSGDKRVLQLQVFNSDGTSSGYIQFINTGAGVKSINTNFPKPANW